MRPVAHCLLLTVALIALAAMACGGERAPSQGPASLIGRWEGRWEGTTGAPGCTSDRLVMEIFRQEGARFDARVDGGCGGSFAANGELSGSTLKLQGTAAAGSITYRGSLKDGNRMSGDWQVAVNPNYKGTWQVTKVSEQVSAVGSPTPTVGRTPSPSPAPGATPTPQAAPADSGDAFLGVPLPSGATLESSVRIPGPPPVPVPLPTGTFAQWEIKTYRVRQSARQVAQFYRDRMPQQQWSSPFTVEEEVPSFSSFMVFQRTEEGRVVVVIVAVEASDSEAKLAIFRSS